MLNPFPIQFLALFAYFILRLCVAGVLLYLAGTQLHHAKKFKDRIHVIRGIAAIEAGIAICFIIGAYTQYGALALMGLSVYLFLYHKRFPHGELPPRLFYTLLLGTALTLFITGAGVLAFDMPI